MIGFEDSDPWSTTTEPALAELPPLPELYTRLVTKFDSGQELTPDEIDYLAGIDEADLAEVQLLERDGWQLLLPDPQLWLSPAVWPATCRTWIPDQRPRFVVSIDEEGELGGISRADPADLDEWDSYADRDATQVGLALPPRNRLWFLKSPFRDRSVQQIFNTAITGAVLASDHGGYSATDIYKQLKLTFAADPQDP